MPAKILASVGRLPLSFLAAALKKAPRSATRGSMSGSANPRSILGCSFPYKENDLSQRFRSIQAPNMTASKAITYSETEDMGQLQQLQPSVSALLVDGGGRWTLSLNRKGLERQFHFKTFKMTWVRALGYAKHS